MSNPNLPLSDEIKDALEAVGVLRDHAREHGMTHFIRDPLVMRIHRALDRIATLEQQLAEAQASHVYEKNHRVYYQDIVYRVCNELDRVLVGRTVCGTADSPATQVQDRIEIVVNANRDLQKQLRDEAKAWDAKAVEILTRLVDAGLDAIGVDQALAAAEARGCGGDYRKRRANRAGRCAIEHIRRWIPPRL